MSTTKSKSPTKRRPQTGGVSPSKTKTSVAAGNPRSGDYEARGLSNNEVELEHLRTIVTEIKRERDVAESLRKDNAMLREQLRRSEEVR